MLKCSFTKVQIEKHCYRKLVSLCITFYLKAALWQVPILCSPLLLAGPHGPPGADTRFQCLDRCGPGAPLDGCRITVPDWLGETRKPGALDVWRGFCTKNWVKSSNHFALNEFSFSAHPKDYLLLDPFLPPEPVHCLSRLPVHRGLSSPFFPILHAQKNLCWFLDPGSEMNTNLYSVQLQQKKSPDTEFFPLSCGHCSHSRSLSTPGARSNSLFLLAVISRGQARSPFLREHSHKAADTGISPKTVFVF